MLVNPRVDIAFKKIFGVEENKDILMSLLNAIVTEEDQMDDIELLNPYNERNFKGDKLSILDVKARNKHTKTYFLVEMQIADEMQYHKRSLYSWARMYANQLGTGQHYNELRKTIAVHILNFTFIDYEKQKGWVVADANKYHHRFLLTDVDTRLHIHTDIEIHTLELNKFAGAKAEDLDSMMVAVKSMLDVWLAVLTHHELLTLDTLPKVLDTPEVRKALNVMETVNFTPIEREMYDAHLDFWRMEYEAFRTHFIKEREEGRVEGRVEERKKIARSLLLDGVSAESVAKNTHLSLEEVLKIKASLV
jgi:predicted transposase/invertase (TIGR01784 family)